MSGRYALSMTSRTDAVKPASKPAEPTTRSAPKRAAPKRAAPKRSTPTQANRGPAAAAENRAAILNAARRLLAEQGYDIPLSSIAREAGVSQGVMYRHFRSRLELALEVFEDNFVAMEDIVESGGERAIFQLWDWLLVKAVDDVGFIEALRTARAEVADYNGATRLRSQLDIALDRARKAGLEEVGQLQAEDLAQAWRMAHGLVITSRDGEVTPQWLGEILSLEAVRRLLGR